MTAQTPGQATREAFGELGADWYPGTPWNELHEDLRVQWEAAAQAAIDAWQRQNAESVARTSRAIREALGNSAVAVAPAPDLITDILRVIDETPHVEFSAIAREPQPAPGQAADVLRRAVEARIELWRQVGETSEDLDGLAAGARDAVRTCAHELSEDLATWQGQARDFAAQERPAPERRALLDIIAEVDQLDEPGPAADWIRMLAEYGLGERPHPDGGVRERSVSGERTADEVLTADQLLALAAGALWGCVKAALTVEHSLDKPYEDDPRWSPWTRWVERPTRTAHDLRRTIRKFRAAQTVAPDPQPAPELAEAAFNEWQAAFNEWQAAFNEWQAAHPRESGDDLADTLPSVEDR